jgi:hypothetical protein
MKYISAVSTLIFLLFTFVMDGRAADCKCQCLDRDGSVFARPPGPKTPEVCAEICSKIIINGKGLASSCPVEGKPPSNGAAKPAGSAPPAQ